MTARPRVIAGIILLVLAAFLGGFSAGAWAGAHHYAGPSCPTEDSCSVQYYGGTWHITPVTP